MKTVSVTTTKQGKQRCVVDLDPGEFLIVIRPEAYYRLGGQVEDVVGGHILTESERVAWCSVSQRWEGV